MTKIMSTVPLSFLKPHCDSGVTRLAIVDVSLSMTLARTFPSMAIEEIPLLSEQMDLSPLILEMVTMLTSFHCWGTRSRFHTSKM